MLFPCGKVRPSGRRRAHLGRQRLPVSRKACRRLAHFGPRRGWTGHMRAPAQVVDAYRGRRFAEALRLALEYDAAAAGSGGDAAARLYAERSARLLAEPPPPGWDGTHVLTEK